jgi:hydrogenase-1 operon protein HyaF
MSTLDGIGISIERVRPLDTGNDTPVLYEIRHALEALQRSGQSTTIDLSAIPFAPGDRDRLLETLGTGEVTACIEALGKTLIRETALAGVWLVDYRSPNDNELALHIEVTRSPSLLNTPIVEVSAALERLGDQLASTVPAAGGKEE